MKLPGDKESDERAEIANMVKVGVSIANIDFKLTNKELKELKLFSDKVIQYHEDLQAQVTEELIKLNMEAQFRRIINNSSQLIY